MHNKINIIHIISSLGKGGAETMLYNLIHNSNTNIFSHHVISLTGMGFYGNKIMKIGFNVIPLHLNKLFLIPFSIYKLIKSINELDPDIIHAWMYHSNLISAIIYPLFPSLSILWAIHHSLHNFHNRPLKNKIIIKLNSILSFIKYVYKIIFVSEISFIQHKSIGFNENNKMIIPNGFDMSIYNSDENIKKDVRFKLKIFNDQILIGLIGRYHPLKDHNNFLNALAYLKINYSINTVKSILVGRGINKKNLELSARINSLGLSDDIILIDETDNISDFFKSLDILCLSSSSEAFPNVIGEAMATCVPCVVTDVGDAAYLIGDTGFVVPPNNPIELAKGLAKMALLPKTERIILGRKARDRINKLFSIDAIVQRYETLYQETYHNKK